LKEGQTDNYKAKYNINQSINLGFLKWPKQYKILLCPPGPLNNTKKYKLPEVVHCYYMQQQTLSQTSSVVYNATHTHTKQPKHLITLSNTGSSQYGKKFHRLNLYQSISAADIYIHILVFPSN